MKNAKPQVVTVKELIEVLSKFPPGLEVWIYDDSLLREPEPKIEKFASKVVTM